MKNVMKKLVLLSFAVVLSVSPIATLDNGMKVEAAETSFVVEKKNEKTNNNEKIGVKNAQRAQAESSTNKNDTENVTLQSTSTISPQAIKAKVSPGVWFNSPVSANYNLFQFAVPSTGIINIKSNSSDFYIEVYNSSGIPITSSTKHLKSDTSYTYSLPVTKGTYYLVPFNYDSAQIMYTFAPESPITYNQIYTVSSDYNAKYYYKFVAPNNGVVNVSSINCDCSDLVICDSTKTPITTSSLLYSDSSSYSNRNFGVKKGGVYYILFSNASGLNQFKATFKAYTNKIATKKSKAIKLKKSKTTSGVLYAGATHTLWYKFNVPAKKNFTVDIKGYTTGAAYVKVWGPSKYGTCCSYISTFSPQCLIKTTGKVKGTFYVKIYTTDKTATGGYSIKWK